MPATPNKLAVFASGTGSNAEAIIEYFKNHPLISVDLVLSNNADAGVLVRAKANKIHGLVFDKRQFGESDEVLKWLIEKGITHVILAGFLWLIPPAFLHAFPGRIINIHPSLLPKFGGKGMYGRKVHEAVKAGSEKETGITIHLVNEQFDEGKILLQERCLLLPTDSVETIALKVRAMEHTYYPKAIETWILK